VGWNVTVEGGKKRLTFPKARYLVPQGDWDHFTRAEVMEQNPPIGASVVALKELGAMELVKGEVTITPEITLAPTPGHTPGHQSVLVSSGGEKTMLVGDLFHSTVQLIETEWNVGADWDKQLAPKTRRTWLDRLERERALVGVGHLPIGSNIGHIVRLKGRRYWQALP
jgi:glyoxylase-like metal-dependent hydrolase (beta-lactamase superfamily II)